MHLPGKTVHITPKSMAVLQCLAEARGDVVPRNDILDKVWPGAAVTDDVLTQCIVELRKAFDDSANDPQFIETIPRKGFRLVAPVADFEEEPAARRPFRAIIAAALIIAIIAIPVTAYFYHARQVPPDVPKTIAVLPFTDLSLGSDRGVFADGLTEELINHLMQLDGLAVTGRASSFAFKERGEDLQSIGERLSVRYLLDGSIRRVDDELRVTAKLVNVGSGVLEWSDTYPVGVDDPFAVQERIAEAVVTTLSVGLGVGGIATMEGGTRDIKAYEAYLAGEVVFRGSSAPNVFRAVDYFEEAVGLDPNFALAWVRLAEVLNWAANEWTPESERVQFRERRDQAMSRALSLAPDYIEALTTLASFHIFEHNYMEARLILDDVHARYPGPDIPYSFTFLDLSLKMGSIAGTLEALESLRRRDPLNPQLPNFVAQLYLLWDQPEDALAELERAVETGRLSPGMIEVTLTAALATGRREAIARALERIRDYTVASRGVNRRTPQDVLLELLDDREALHEYIAGAQSLNLGHNVDFFLTMWAAYLEDDEMALVTLRRNPDAWAYWHPLLKQVRKTEDFKQILIDDGVVDYWREFGWGNFCRPTDGDDFECE